MDYRLPLLDFSLSEREDEEDNNEDDDENKRKRRKKKTYGIQPPRPDGASKMKKPHVKKVVEPGKLLEVVSIRGLDTFWGVYRASVSAGNLLSLLFPFVEGSQFSYSSYKS